MIKFNDIIIDRKDNTISRNGVVCRFDSTQGNYSFQIMECLLLSGGITKQKMFDTLYGDREDGGPDEGVNIIQVKLCQLDDRIKRLGLELRVDRPGHHKKYWLVSPMHGI